MPATKGDLDQFLVLLNALTKTLNELRSDVDHLGQVFANSISCLELGMQGTMARLADVAAPPPASASTSDTRSHDYPREQSLLRQSGTFLDALPSLVLSSRLLLQCRCQAWAKPPTSKLRADFPNDGDTIILVLPLYASWLFLLYPLLKLMTISLHVHMYLILHLI